MANDLIKNDTAITLDWADVSGANKYQVEVSLVPDFSDSLIVNDATLAVSTKSFTDSGTNNAKRYWRWRSSSDGGTTWGAWSEVGSYWYNSAFSGDIALSNNQWEFVNPSDVTDKYLLTTFPLYSIQPQLLARIRERNRKGTLLSEYITAKDFITLGFDSSCWMIAEQYREFIRFHRDVKTFFAITLKSNGVDYVPNVWKVQCQTDPSLTMIAAGRQDIFIGDIILEEV